MKYISGEEVQLLDQVELLEGGVWFKAKVVFISDINSATDEYKWIVEEEPEWANGLIAVKWDEFEEIESFFFASKEAEEIASAEILFTETKNNDELRFVKRYG